MLFSDGACSRRVSLSLCKAFLFSAKKYKAQERGERKSWELGESGRCIKETGARGVSRKNIIQQRGKMEEVKGVSTSDPRWDEGNRAVIDT